MPLLRSLTDHRHQQPPTDTGGYKDFAPMELGSKYRMNRAQRNCGASEKLRREDCLVWMLFNGSNLTASANDLEWNGKKWSIVNHFIP